MNGVPYGLILLVTAGVLVFRHTGCDRASPRSKEVLVGLYLVSLFVYLIFLDGPIYALVPLLGICGYVILHRLVEAEMDKLDRRDRELEERKDIGAGQ